MAAKITACVKESVVWDPRVWKKRGFPYDVLRPPDRVPMALVGCDDAV